MLEYPLSLTLEPGWVSDDYRTSPRFLWE